MLTRSEQIEVLMRAGIKPDMQGQGAGLADANKIVDVKREMTIGGLEMKKKIAVIVLLILGVALGTAYAAVLWNGQRTSILSSSRTTSAAVVSGPGILHGIVVITDGTNNATLNLYDNASAAVAGTYQLPLNLVALGGSKTTAISFSPPLNFASGVYVSLTCAGTASYQLNYDQ